MAKYLNQFQQQYEEGFEVELPGSKQTVRVRSVSTEFLLKTGKLSNILESEIGSKVVLGDGLKENELSASALQEAMVAIGDYNRALCESVFVDPVIVDEPSAKNEIKYEWLPEQDVEFIRDLMDKPLDEWRRFPSETD